MRRRVIAGRGLAEQAQFGLAAGVLICALVAFHFWSLLHTPLPFVDEAWRASRAWAWLHTGRNFGTLDAGVFDRYDGYWTFFPYLDTLPLTVAIQLLGLSLLSVRLVSLIAGMLLLVAILKIADTLYGHRVALLATLLTGASIPFLYSAHLARQDIMVAALGYAALALYLRDHSQGFPWMGILAGLASGLAFEIHPNGMIYVPVIVGLYLFDHGRRVFRARSFYGFLVGLGAGLIFYAALHIIPYPQTYLQLTRMGYGPSHTPPLLAMSPAVWGQSVVDTARLLAASNHLAVPLLPAGMVSLWRRRSSAGRKLLALLALLLVAFIALVRNKSPYYAILIAPAAEILLAAWLAGLWEGMRAGQRVGALARAGRRCLFILSCILVLVACIAGLAPALHDPMPEWNASLDYIRQVVPRGSTVMGSQSYWFALPNARFLSWENIAYYRRYDPGATLEQALADLHPDWLIIDRQMEQFMTDDPAHLTDYGRALYVPRSELQAFLDKHARLTDQFTSRIFGSARLYRIEWR